MDQNNGPEAMIFKEEIRTTLTIDSGESPLLFIKTSPQDQTLPSGTITRTTEDRLTNAQFIHSIELIETDLEMNFSTIRIEIGGILEVFFRSPST